MPDVSILDFSVPYVAGDQVQVKQKQALTLIQQLLDLQGLTDAHHNEVLGVGIWKWTEAAGVSPRSSYNLRFVSEGALHPTGPASINHEHVWPRKWLIQRLRGWIWSTEELEEFLLTYAVACTVTVAEHALLSAAPGEGWVRYLSAGIAVWDRAEERYLDMPRVCADPKKLLVPSNKPGGPTPVTAGRKRPQVDLGPVLEAKITNPALRCCYERLLRTARFASAISVPAFTQKGTPSAYFRIHDALVNERTPTVAFPHWTGKIDFRLIEEDLPAALRGDRRVKVLDNVKGYRISCKLVDESSLELAEELLFLSLQKLRLEWLSRVA